METTFLLWSASATSQASRPDVAGAGGVYLPHPASGTLLLPAPPSADLEASRDQSPAPQQAPAPRTSKKKKPAAAPKRPPQRGLGVEKLERLRLQERWRKMTEIEPPLAEQQSLTPPAAGSTLNGHQHNHSHHHQLLLQYAVGGQYQPPHSPFGLCSSFPVYDSQHQAGVSRLSLARFAAAPAPVGYGGAWGESCFLQRHRVLGAAGGVLGSSGAISGVRSAAFADNGGMDRFRMATAETSFQVGGKPSELSSSQSLQCSEECDICIRNRILEEKLRTGGGGIGASGVGKQPLYLFAVADRKADAPADQEVVEVIKGGRAHVKQYEFFPCSTTTTSGGGSSSQTTAGELPSPSSVSARSSTQTLDLSLKLSL